MSYDWNGERTRRVVLMKRLFIAALVTLFVATVLLPLIGLV